MTLKDYVAEFATPDRIDSLIGKHVQSADPVNPQHGIITRYDTEFDPDYLIIKWDDGYETQVHPLNEFVTLIEVLG